MTQSPAGWLPRTGISSGTLRSVIEYGLPLPFYLLVRLDFVPSVSVRTPADKILRSAAFCLSVFCLLLVDHLNFYRAMLCIRGISHGPVSVRHKSTAKRRITQTTPHDSPWTLVFWSQRSPRNSTGVTPYGGAKCRWGGSKSSTFAK